MRVDQTTVKKKMDPLEGDTVGKSQMGGKDPLLIPVSPSGDPEEPFPRGPVSRGG